MSMQNMIESRSMVLCEKPFFGALALKMEMIEDKNCKTLWTDGETIGFNPDFVESLPVYVRKLAIKHELYHVIFNHNTRRNGRDDKMWQQACDYAVNFALHSEGETIPKDWTFSTEYGSKSAEEIYLILSGQQQKEDNQQQQQQNGKQQNGQQQQQPQTGNGQQQQQNGQPQNGNQSNPFKKDKTTQQTTKENGIGEVRDLPNKEDKTQPATETQKQQEEEKWHVAVCQAKSLAEKAGEIEGNLKEIINGLLEPKLNWKEVLNRFILEQVKNDYSWSRPNTRYLQSGFILPSLHNTELKRILVAIDTSGSINDKDKKQFCSEISEIVESFNVPIEVVYCDTKVRHTEEFTQENLPVKLDFKGGGGTKFYPVMNYIEKMDIEPACLVYLTDLECEKKDFGNEPDMPTLWVQTRGNVRKNVPFGEVVLLK